MYVITQNKKEIRLPNVDEIHSSMLVLAEKLMENPEVSKLGFKMQMNEYDYSMMFVRENVDEDICKLYIWDNNCDYCVGRDIASGSFDWIVYCLKQQSYADDVLRALLVSVEKKNAIIDKNRQNSKNIHSRIQNILSANVIPQIISRLQKEIPQKGKIDRFVICFDIPQVNAVGSMELKWPGEKYLDLRAFDVKIQRTDMDYECTISVLLKTNTEIIEYLNEKDIASTLADKYKNIARRLFEEDDGFDYKVFDEMWG